MKKYLILAAAAAAAMTLIPVAICGSGMRQDGDAGAFPQAQTAPSADGTAETDAPEAIRVYMPADGSTQTLPMEDYVIRAVAAEMPAVYEPEALKAQAAACATLARYMQKNNKKNKTLSGAVIAADAGTYQGYMTEDEMRSRWGEDFGAYYEKLKTAVEAVLPYTILYEGEPILAAFHAVSSGVTERAETLWGKEIPYLVNVESEGDRLSPGYASEETVTPEAFREKLGFSTKNADPETWVGEAVYSDAGTLLELPVGDRVFTGAALRAAFSLRSPAVSVEFDGGNFVLRVTGYGHGIGMSQYGADYYARQGMTWKEILAHYYPGTEIGKISA